MSDNAAVERLKTSGRLWIRGALSDQEVESLRAYTDVSSKPGRRLTGKLPPVETLRQGGELSSLLNSQSLSRDPVRIVGFNKTEGSNWGVPWHQDRVIAVQDQVAAEGFSNFVRKPSFWHCEPPASMMERMVFVRLLLDSDTEKTGPLEIALGSHRHGTVASDAAAGIALNCNIEPCFGKAGDVLVLHALILHRSNSASAPSSRRSLRLDFADRSALPPDMAWAC